MGDAHMGLQARLMSQALRKLTAVIAKSKSDRSSSSTRSARRSASCSATPRPRPAATGAEILLVGAPRHPQDRDAQGRRGEVVGNRVRGEGGQEQGGPTVPAGRVRHHLRFGHLPGRRRSGHGGRHGHHREVRHVVSHTARPHRTGPGKRAPVPEGQQGHPPERSRTACGRASASPSSRTPQSPPPRAPRSRRRARSSRCRRRRRRSCHSERAVWPSREESPVPSAPVRDPSQPFPEPSLFPRYAPVVSLRRSPLAPLAYSLGCGGGGSPSSPASPGAPPPDLESLLRDMTLDEKVGQMTQADRSYLRSDADIRGLFLGSAAERRRLVATGQDGAGLGGDVRPLPGDRAPDAGSRSPSSTASTPSTATTTWSGAVIFPHNIGLGCTRDAALVERVARATAEEVAATGVDWTFSPCVAVARDERWGRTYESFGETPELVSEMATAAVRGYQPTILACAKHYLADGGTAGGRDQGDAQMDEATLRAIHLPGLSGGGRGRRRLGDGLLQQLERPEDARPPLPAHGRAEGRAGLPGLRRLRLGRHRPAAGRLHLGRRDLDQRRHRHGDGARALPGVRRHAAVARPVRPRPPGAHRRRRAAHPAPEVRARALGQALRGPLRSSPRSAPTRTGRSGARRCGSPSSS